MDTRTFIAVLTFQSAFLALLMYFYLRTRKTYPGFKRWAAATAVLALGYLLVSLRGRVPDALSILVANEAYAVAAAMYLAGVAAFLDVACPVWLLGAGPAATLAGLSWYYWVTPFPAARGLVVALGMSVPLLPTAWLLVRHASARHRSLYNYTALMLVILCAAGLLRSAYWVWFEPAEGVMTASAGHAVYFFVAMAAMLGGVLGLMMMNGQRLDDELRASRRALQTTAENLSRALSQVRQLSGLLPICAACKKIRDDQGYWHQVESYVQEHTGATFTHGICPECRAKLYPTLPGNAQGKPEPKDE
ncbi:MAG: hypothetical protein KQJ78_13530 [Deltaproteobacteria bacterium]|nr:hypothetical protein [Deltaproteobacteria bacterium]